MTTTLSTKLAALVLALGINSAILGSVALVFNAHPHDFLSATVASVTHRYNRAA